MIGPLRRLKLYDCHAERSRAELSEAKHVLVLRSAAEHALLQQSNQK